MASLTLAYLVETTYCNLAAIAVGHRLASPRRERIAVAVAASRHGDCLWRRRWLWSRPDKPITSSSDYDKPRAGEATSRRLSQRQCDFATQSVVATRPLCRALTASPLVKRRSLAAVAPPLGRRPITALGTAAARRSLFEQGSRLFGGRRGVASAQPRVTVGGRRGHASLIARHK